MEATPAQPPSDDSAPDQSATDAELIGLALTEAALAIPHGDVPVGAVVVIDGQVVASRHNERARLNDPTAHAEILALRDAAAIVGDWRLNNATLAVTLEPCPMCAGALWASRIGRVVFGAYDEKAGACSSLYNIGADPRLGFEYGVRGGVRSDECGRQLSEFFQQLRADSADTAP